jgi:hypothetical protein
MVYSKNAFLTQAEMQVNAQYIWDYLAPLGWTKNAVAGMLGNMQTESTINPGIWQSLDSGNMSMGYGLVQWTPASKYTNWADSNGYSWGDINGQLQRLEYELANGLQWISTSSYPMSFAEFKVSTETPTYLAAAFITNYERPADPVQPARGTQAEYWFSFLQGEGGGAGGYQLAVLPIKYMNISQGENGSFSHQGSWAMDFDTPTDDYPYYAPCDAECIQRNDSAAILVWKSQREVMCADGQVRQIVWRCIHDDVLDFNVGDKLLKGEFMGNTGNGGQSSGDHLHLDAWLGDTYTGSNPLHLYDVFAVNGVEIVNDGGYDWIISDYIDGSTGGGNGSGNNRDRDAVALFLCGALKGW